MGGDSDALYVQTAVTFRLKRVLKQGGNIIPASEPLSAASLLRPPAAVQLTLSPSLTQFDSVGKGSTRQLDFH